MFQDRSEVSQRPMSWNSIIRQPDLKYVMYICVIQIGGNVVSYRFDLVLRHQNGGGSLCKRDNGEEERCHAEVAELGKVEHCSGPIPRCY